MKVLEERISRDTINSRYCVTVSDSLTNSKAASIIADAVLFDPKAVQLVARSNGNNLEIEKDWELMSELDKDEFTHKKILRQCKIGNNFLNCFHHIMKAVFCFEIFK